MKTLRSRSLVLASAALVMGVSGCGVLVGLGDFKEGPASGGPGGTGGSGGATTTSTASSDVGGLGSTGGGGTGGVACMPVAETCASPSGSHDRKV